MLIILSIIALLAIIFLKFTSAGQGVIEKIKEMAEEQEKELRRQKAADERFLRQRQNDRETEELFRRRRENPQEFARQEMKEQRDLDRQIEPYPYQIGRHANETLALRYGIANLDGVDGRGKPANFISLRKLEKIEKDVYLVEIADFRNRNAKAVIEVGTEYVKTFLPISEDWFSKYANLEETLKGNKTMSLKDIARFHVEKVAN